MRPFAYERATDAAGAVAALERGGDGARYLGGGTNLVDLMKLGVETPQRLVDVSRLDLGAIELLDGGGLRIGAGVRMSELAADRVVRERWPVLAQALLGGASGQLRNLATIGGNLLQRTRCPYFQDVSAPCNKRVPGSGCSAREGVHANLAILGASEHCIATNPSDMAVALVALDALVHVHGTDGPRTIELAQLHRLPGDEPQRETNLRPADLITAVELPALALAAHSAWRKVRERASFSFAVVSVAAALDVADGTIRDCRLALGGVAHRPWRALAAESALRGGPATTAAFAVAAEAELEAARPLRDNAYKVGLARDVMIRTLEGLA
ncbi:MAG: xanthine dehydrogenase YagS FAD-binding subunit [Solirubrobacteraceae bacterium]|jgi:xanthine dehydrogenase YagS FAD-binding subunit|nr:xanthine dehydrogenase YagS FAD-binding subunit [Solirubrobacteraceae bacterium]